MSFYRLLQQQAYHTASPEAVHTPVHGGIAVYTKIPGSSKIGIGTLSGVVIDRSTKKKLLLSNQHVFFPTGPNAQGQPGLPIYMTADSSKPIARTLITKAEQNPWPSDKIQQALSTVGTYHDSALATPLVPVSMTVNNIGVQRSVVEPKRDMRIKFFGRTSRMQRGVITNPSYNYHVDSGSGKISMRKDVIQADIASAPGDSGSMVFTEDNHVIGIHFGTAGGRAIINKASAIARAYNVAFSEEEVPGSETQPQPQPEPPKPTPIPIPEIKLPTIVMSDSQKIVVGAIVGLGFLSAFVLTVASDLSKK